MQECDVDTAMFFEDLEPEMRFTTMQRTITEDDLLG